MSSTNKTTNIELSQYIATDKPTYLVDYNGDMLKIDNAIGADRDAIATAQSTATGADNKADANTSAIQALDEELNDGTTGLATKLNDLIGDVNTIESLIGNGTPTAGDHTIIGAANANTENIGDLTELETINKTDLVSAVNEVKNSVESKSGYVTGRKFIIIGDSYGAQQTNWIDRLITILGIPNDKVTKIVKGGAGFTAGAAGGQFITEFNSVVTAVDTEVTDVVVCAGINDYNATEQTITAAIANFRSGVLAKCPNATIHIGMISWSKSHSYIPALHMVFKAYRIACADNPDMHFLDGVQMAMHRYDLFTDDIHPNGNGAFFIARCVKEALINGKVSIPFEKITLTQSALIATSDFDITFSGDVDNWITEDNTYFSISRIGIVPKDGETYNPDTFYKLFDFPEASFMLGGSIYQPYFSAIGYDSSNNLVFCDLSCYDGSLWIRWRGAITDFRSLIIDGITIIFPLMYEQ